ncbi:hypothetical protein L3X38_035508 [Prunus dulcis]|uniref:Uncharacterized protein n=1 Tax=Prunus dulcis TaxID=3755 RepID=A0AAD4VLB6_PRUDU|nr:hypothetical protein L3X38_035508 [Prunus dulcis]
MEDLIAHNKEVDKRSPGDWSIPTMPFFRRAEMAKMPLTKQFVLFPFCPSSLAERVWFAETGLGFSSFPTSWLGGSHGRAVSVGRDVLEAVDFWLGSFYLPWLRIFALLLFSLNTSKSKGLKICIFLPFPRLESLGIIVGIIFLVLGILFQFFNFTANSNLVGGQPWENSVRCWTCVGGRRFLFGR